MYLVIFYSTEKGYIKRDDGAVFEIPKIDPQIRITLNY